MKVVLFCGGQGLRLRDFSDTIPKPMVPIGYRPILWHLMKYYAHFGHREFILCLGHRADYIKDYFLNYNEAISNDFVLTSGGRDVKLLNNDISDWKITFVDTGVESNLGQRLLAVREHLQGEEMFLANYSDNLTDANLDDMVARVRDNPALVGGLITVKPGHSYHVVRTGDDGATVTAMLQAHECGVYINGGFFVFRQEIFDHIRPGEELVIEPFNRLIAQKRLAAYRHDGFWACMDTFKEKQHLDDLYSRGKAPWEIWKPQTQSARRPA